MKFESTGIKDIILPGEIRDIMNTVLVAEKKAQASQEILRLYEEMIATKIAWLLRLFVCLCVVTFAFLFVVIFDLMIPSIGFFRG